MPVSKKRKQNNRPTQSKKISSQMSTSDVPSPRWYTISVSYTHLRAHETEADLV